MEVLGLVPSNSGAVGGATLTSGNVDFVVGAEEEPDPGGPLVRMVPSAGGEQGLPLSGSRPTGRKELGEKFYKL